MSNNKKEDKIKYDSYAVVLKDVSFDQMMECFGDKTNKQITDGVHYSCTWNLSFLDKDKSLHNIKIINSDEFLDFASCTEWAVLYQNKSNIKVIENHLNKEVNNYRYEKLCKEHGHTM